MCGLLSATLTGCSTLPRPATGDVTYNHIDNQQAASDPELPDVSEPVTVLLVMGSALVLMSLGQAAVVAEDGDTEMKVVAITTGAIGFSVLGIAGLVALTEDDQGK